MEDAAPATNAEISAHTMERLEEIYAAAPGTGTPSEAVAMMVAPFLTEVGADAGFVGAVAADGRTIEVARVTPYSKAPVRLAFALDAPYPLAATIRRAQPLFIASNEQLACDHPGLIRVEAEDHACATMPLLAEDGELLGALNLGFEDPHEFTDEERTAIEQLAARCARAFDDLRRV
jgi:GAF domain-containing protein